MFSWLDQSNGVFYCPQFVIILNLCSITYSFHLKILHLKNNTTMFEKTNSKFQTSLKQWKLLQAARGNMWFRLKYSGSELLQPTTDTHHDAQNVRDGVFIKPTSEHCSTNMFGWWRRGFSLCTIACVDYLSSVLIAFLSIVWKIDSIMYTNTIVKDKII